MAKKPNGCTVDLPTSKFERRFTMKKLGIFAIGMCLGFIFGSFVGGDVINSTTYMLTPSNEEPEETEDE
jgi:hypothetical protein